MKKERSKIYFLTFCSQGPPFDGGKDLRQNACNLRNLLAGIFDDVIIYTPETLKLCPGSEEFCNFQGEDFPLNPGMSSLGCGDFKSFIVDKTLGEIEEDAFLFYHDCNFSKYSQYWQTDWENLQEIFEFFLKENSSDFYFSFESKLDSKLNLVRFHGKRYTTDYIIGNSEESELVSNCYEIASSRMIIRNTPKSRQFFSEFKELCRKNDLLSKYPNPNPYPEFTHSTVDQHVLNCLVYKWILDEKLDATFPKFMLLNRRLRIDENLSMLRNDELTKYMEQKVIKKKIQEIKSKGNDNNIRGTQEFGKDIFVT